MPHVMRLLLALALAGCASDSADSCPMTVEKYCDGKTRNCPPTLSDAQKVASWNCGNGNGGLVTLTSCGDVHIASIAFIDAGEDFYYDANGQLFRVEEFVNTTQHCAAGAGEALECNDPNPITICTP
jgi:hypothetical protein